MTEEAVRVTPQSRHAAESAGGPAPVGRRSGSGRPGGLPVPTELLVLLATILAVLIAAAVADDFGAGAAWTLVTVLSSAYILSRGLAKHEHSHDGGRLG